MNLAVGFAFGAGVATFFAPCAFPLLPGYVAYYLGRGDEGVGTVERLRRAAVVGTVTSLGFLLVYGVLVAIVASVGASALQDIAVLEPIIGSALVVLGATAALGYTFDNHIPLPERRRSVSGYFAFGVVYGAAAAGCTAPVFVAIALLGLSAGPVGAVLTLGAYALGMVVLMLLVTGLSALGRDRALRLLSRNTGRLSRVAGVLLVFAGLAQIYLWYFDFDTLGGLRALGLL